MRKAVGRGRVWRVSTAVMAFHVVAACGPAVETVERRDSLGVAIVESHAPAWGVGPSWQLDTSPRLSLGRDDGEPAELFHRLVATVRQPNGDVAVMDGATQELRLFDSAGRHRWTFGRRGAAPVSFGRFSPCSGGPATPWRSSISWSDGSPWSHPMASSDASRPCSPAVRAFMASRSLMIPFWLPRQ